MLSNLPGPQGGGTGPYLEAGTYGWMTGGRTEFREKSGQNLENEQARICRRVRFHPMPMWMSPQDVSSFVTQAIYHVADGLRVPECDLKSPTELITEIRNRSEDIADKLCDFLLAYERWHSVNAHIERFGSTDRRLELLTEGVAERDRTRAELIRAFGAGLRLPR